MIIIIKRKKKKNYKEECLKDFENECFPLLFGFIS